jgi:hypothetical protein
LSAHFCERRRSARWRAARIPEGLPMLHSQKHARVDSTAVSAFNSNKGAEKRKKNTTKQGATRRHIKGYSDEEITEACRTTGAIQHNVKGRRTWLK